MDRTAGMMPLWGAPKTGSAVAPAKLESLFTVPQAKPGSAFKDFVATVQPVQAAAPKPTAKPEQPIHNMAESIQTIEKIEAASAQLVASSTSFERTAGSIQHAEMTFADMIDVVNPLQHIPVLSGVYRNVTGDEISTPAKIAGGALYGGPVGAASSIATAMVEEHSGKSIQDHVFSAMRPTPPAAKPSLTGDTLIGAQFAGQGRSAFNG